MMNSQQTMAAASFPGAANGFTYPNMYGAGGVQQPPQGLGGGVPGLYGGFHPAGQAGGVNGVGTQAEAMGKGSKGATDKVAEGSGNGSAATDGTVGAAGMWAGQSAAGVAVPGEPAGASGLDERELKRQRRKQSNRESARRSRLRKQAECEELGSRVGGLTEENEKLRGEVKRLLDQCTALSADNTALRKSVQAAGGVVDTPPPELPAGPTWEEKEAAAKAGAAAAAEAMKAAKKAAALAAGDSDDEEGDKDGSKDEGGDDNSTK